MALILGQVLLNLFVAGNMENAAEGAGDMIANVVEGSAGFGFSTLAGLVSARAAEETTNGLLIWRLGRAAKRRLRPIEL